MVTICDRVKSRVFWGMVIPPSIGNVFFEPLLLGFMTNTGNKWEFRPLPETNSSHLKMDGWNTIVSCWDGLLSGALAVSFRKCNVYMGQHP